MSKLQMLCQWYSYDVLDAGHRHVRRGYIRGRSNRLAEIMLPGSPLFTELPRGCTLTVQSIKTKTLRERALYFAKVKGVYLTGRKLDEYLKTTDHIQIDLEPTRRWIVTVPPDLAKRREGETGTTRLSKRPMTLEPIENAQQ